MPFQFANTLLAITLLVGGSLVSVSVAQVTITPGTVQQSGEELEEESQPDSGQAEESVSDSDSNRVSQKLAYAHFIPLTNSPGNQIKVVTNFTIVDSSVLNKPINAVMEIYSANGSLLRTSSFPDPIIANQSGTIQLATTFIDESMNGATAVARITGAGKMLTISNPITIDLKLGQIIE